MIKTPLLDRIQIFLAAFPYAKRIPVHPDDYEAAKKLAEKHSFPLKVTCLGHRELKELGSSPPAQMRNNANEL